MERPIVKVVCGIIIKEGAYFIAKRKDEKHLGGYWEFPGGKLESEEDPQEALKRELMEELGMKVEGIQFFGRHVYVYDHITIETHSLFLFLQRSYFSNDRSFRLCLY